MIVEFEIEHILKGKEPSILARHLRPAQRFSMVGKCFLKGIEIEPALTQPRAMDENGKLRSDLYMFFPLNKKDVGVFEEGMIVQLITKLLSGIWHVENKSYNQIRLWRTDDSTFRVIEDGNYLPLLTNPSYTLINKKYQAIFVGLEEKVIIRPVRLYDFILKIENLEYVELTFLNKIDLVSIYETDSEGFKAWTYNGYLFVSEDLKNKLQNTGYNEFEFNLGFSRFG